MRTPLVILAVALVATVWLISPALAGPPITQFVKDLMDRVIAIQNDPALASPAQEAERAKAIRRNIQQSFDFQIMAQNSLWPTYGRLSSAQRQEFLKIFSALFQDSYTRLVLNFLKKETVNYRKESQEGDRARDLLRRAAAAERDGLADGVAR